MNYTQQMFLKTSNMQKTQIFKQLLDQDIKKSNVYSKNSSRQKNAEVQTIYRESETQTLPWDPPYRIFSGHSPEVLTLAHFTWENGLPAGVSELKIINRIRMEKAWNTIIPYIKNLNNMKTRATIITALKAEELAIRESEITLIMESRMNLMNEILQRQEMEKKIKMNYKFKKMKEMQEKTKDSTINKIRQNLERDLRKLSRKHEYKHRNSKSDITTNYSRLSLYESRSSTMKGCRRYPKILITELLDEINSESDEAKNFHHWIPLLEEIEKSNPNVNLGNLCAREIKWRKQKLQNLQTDIQCFRKTIASNSDVPTLMKSLHKETFAVSTPTRVSTQDAKDDLNEASLYIQKIIKGRAIQCMMFERKNRAAELIEELQCAHALDENSKKKLQEKMANTSKLQSEYNNEVLKNNHICEVLNSLEGMTVSGLLSFLSTELVRMEDESKVHAFVLSAEKEKCKREAEEAGRRQLEYNSRTEFNEMFKQITKVNQDSVENYLDDIINAEVEWVSETEAKQYIEKLAYEEDKIAINAAESVNDLTNEEMVADMIYNFVLAETERLNLRKYIKEKQQYYLYHIRTLIYDQIKEVLDSKFNENTDNDNYQEISNKVKFEKD